jgi:bacterioferritin
LKEETVNSSNFVLDLKAIRERARDDMLKGAVLSNQRESSKKIAEMLNHALATELTCILRYKQNATVAQDLGAEIVAKEFTEHALEEQQHADTLAARISILGGSPDLNPDHISKNSHTLYRAFSPDDPYVVLDMLKENLVAERIAVETYREMIHFVEDKDPVTRAMLETILAKEEEHADDLAGLLHIHGKDIQQM